MDYGIAYDAATAPSSAAWALAIPGWLGLLGVALIATVFRANARTTQKAFAVAFTLFAALVGGAMAWSLWSQDRLARGAVAQGRARVIEGPVEDFVAMPYTGHALEHFRVGGVKFAYSDYVQTAGFHRSAAHGGPIRAGLPVRIAYVPGTPNEIVRLEVPAGTPLAPASNGRVSLFGPLTIILGVLVFCWLYAWRRRREDPVAGGIFHETMISGRSRRNWLARLGGANNCLEVFVTPERIVIRPIFLFDLLFLTATYGLRQDIPRSALVAAEKKDGLFMKTVLIRWRGEGGEEEEFELFVSDRDAFIRLLSK